MRAVYRKYLVIGLALSLLLVTPLSLVEKLREKTQRTLAFWFDLKGVFQEDTKEDLARLEGENHLLRVEIGKLRALLEQQAKQIGLQEELKKPGLSNLQLAQWQELARIGADAAAAQVIYRDPSSWSSALWVNVGEDTNEQLGSRIIQKNSPVIFGRAVVGVIDYVGKKQSRVRLITDSSLQPSVRAVRGHAQNSMLIQNLDPILLQISCRSELPLSKEERSFLVNTLEKLKERLSSDTSGWSLAKGILQGGGSPLWRSSVHCLKGIGFNYDFADSEGPARELISGKPIDAEGPSLALIQVQDLLVTTGMDGVFPSGLPVAQVTKVHPLKEGAYTYEIEAIPVVGNLDSLHIVFIIPPLGYIPKQAEEFEV